MIKQSKKNSKNITDSENIKEVLLLFSRPTSQLPICMQLTRKVDVFKSSKRIGKSDLHHSSSYQVGFLAKPIANIVKK
ncbi:hypothetical protein [Lewinella cohaerens]|uniref:hypothetical protein n=1 Tax=Lewinella cohaerens TaxID=70995 RepID=UPI000362000F|nr:hypothetical protein [Lewinella cohaerens]